MFDCLLGKWTSKSIFVRVAGKLTVARYCMTPGGYVYRAAADGWGSSDTGTLTGSFTRTRTQSGLNLDLFELFTRIAHCTDYTQSSSSFPSYRHATTTPPPEEMTPDRGASSIIIHSFWLSWLMMFVFLISLFLVVFPVTVVDQYLLFLMASRASTITTNQTRLGSVNSLRKIFLAKPNLIHSIVSAKCVNIITGFKIITIRHPSILSLS